MDCLEAIVRIIHHLELLETLQLGPIGKKHVDSWTGPMNVLKPCVQNVQDTALEIDENGQLLCINIDNNYNDITRLRKCAMQFLKEEELIKWIRIETVTLLRTEIDLKNNRNVTTRVLEAIFHSLARLPSLNCITIGSIESYEGSKPHCSKMVEDCLQAVGIDYPPTESEPFMRIESEEQVKKLRFAASKYWSEDSILSWFSIFPVSLSQTNLCDNPNLTLSCLNAILRALSHVQDLYEAGLYVGPIDVSKGESCVDQLKPFLPLLDIEYTQLPKEHDPLEIHISDRSKLEKLCAVANDHCHDDEMNTNNITVQWRKVFQNDICNARFVSVTEIVLLHQQGLNLTFLEFMVKKLHLFYNLETLHIEPISRTADKECSKLVQECLSVLGIYLNLFPTHADTFVIHLERKQHLINQIVTIVKSYLTETEIITWCEHWKPTLSQIILKRTPCVEGSCLEAVLHNLGKPDSIHKIDVGPLDVHELKTSSPLLQDFTKIIAVDIECYTKKKFKFTTSDAQLISNLRRTTSKHWTGERHYQ